MKMSIFGVILFVAGFCVSQAYAFDDHDTQFWNTDVQEMKLSDTAKIALEEEFRWGDNASDFYYQHYDLGYLAAFNKAWSWGGGYRHVLEEKKSAWLVENEPYLTLTYRTVFKNIALETRNRIEYRHFDYQDDNGRYRNKFTAVLPWKFSRFQIQPYISDEVLFSFYGAAFAKNRLAAGFTSVLTKHVKVEIYYMKEDNRGGGGHWTDINVIGTKIKVAF